MRFKIKVDEKNKVIIATTFYKGKVIKALARCHPEDTFNVEFGTQLAIKKLKVKYKFAKMNVHESYVKDLKAMQKWIDKELESEEKILSNLDKNVLKESDECYSFVKSYFNK